MDIPNERAELLKLSMDTLVDMAEAYEAAVYLPATKRVIVTAILKAKIASES